MKKILFLSLASLFFVACNQDAQTDSASQRLSAETATLSVQENYLEHDNLRVYFVEAPQEFIDKNTYAGNLEVLKTALDQPRFRVSEHKPFGRREDPGAVNQLTVENKLPNDVFLMSGDVVQGGRQDRAIGEDQIIAANSIKNIPVFCVEQGRWTYNHDETETNGRADRIAAFSGYYNVASHGLRKTIKSGNQKAVWDKVAEVTSSNEADSESKAYAGLENSEKFTQTREAYLAALGEGQFNEKTVGIIVATGNEILGSDVFGHPRLFQKTYEALLHGYITDVITKGQPLSVTPEQINQYNKKISRKIVGKQAFKFEGAIIHYSDL